MKKIKQFYEKNKKEIQNYGKSIIGGAVVGTVLGYTYKLGYSKGYNTCAIVSGTLIGVALEKKPNVKLSEFIGKEFLDGLTEDLKKRLG